MNRNLFNNCISNADFQSLFISEMGWNNYHGQSELYPITIDEVEYKPVTIAERNGFQIFTCKTKSIPSTSFCRKIDRQLRPFANDYICIFYVENTEHHLWFAPIKTVDKRDIVTIEYEGASNADFMFSKMQDLSFQLDETTTIVDVKEKVQRAFEVNSAKITKDFYSGFKKEHKAFEEFISGIDVEGDRQWYASVMLNRLMFCYFIQKKGFFDNNTNYLRDKLEWTKNEKKNKTFFQSFYKGFLKELFRGGLNKPKHDRDFKKIYGAIPYLNGGMFDDHQLELDYQDIDIADAAFERLFDFFDKWRWHLDTRITASGHDINPDVLGYIFEQYINDRAAMGAYYTKEDITGYIGRNCIIPFLFDVVAKSCKSIDFDKNEYVWNYLSKSGDRYIYDAVKKGVDKKLPDYIECGIDTSKPNLLERRSRWNEKTPDEYALPTEIWRETVERRQRYAEVRTKIDNEEITNINDFITYNLDIQQFAFDIIEKAKDWKLVSAFYNALREISVLDPTCGSGAFLFAAMNILEPLYDICLTRMEEFHSENSELFEYELNEIRDKYRSNRQYFIYKSIILRNLYGVDIMVEAVEIAKLRLFLKMVAVVEVDRSAENLGLDHLPDIDFNIRCGNTLVGYANEDQLNKDLEADYDIYQIIANEEFKEKIKIAMQNAAFAFENFKAIQLGVCSDSVEIKAAKTELKTQLENLADKLNRRMFMAQRSENPEDRPELYAEWRKSHQPFHWLAEFYNIVKMNGGFDVIIGNPPYVGYTRKNKESNKAVCDIYKVFGLKTIPTSNLYSFCIERSEKMMGDKSKIGMIVPISAFSNDSMAELQNLFKDDFRRVYISTYHQRPAPLFDGVLQRLSIFIANKEGDKEIYTTGIYRWYIHTREILFNNIFYVKCLQNHQRHFVKLGSKRELTIFEKFIGNHRINAYLDPYSKRNDNRLFYRTAGGGYWVTFMNREFDQVSVSNKNVAIQIKYDSKVICAALNSNLFWWYYSINYDLFNFKDYMIFNFSLNYPQIEISTELSELSDKIESFLRTHAFYYEINSKTNGTNTTVSYQKNLSKPIMNEIDKVLAKHYGFTEEELDFIINYDIKYRMGDELGEE